MNVFLRNENVVVYGNGNISLLGEDIMSNFIRLVIILSVGIAIDYKSTWLSSFFELYISFLLSFDYKRMRGLSYLKPNPQNT